MFHRKDADASPFRAGLLHGFLSLIVFGGAAGLVGGLIHVTGDPAEAGPRQVIALFVTEDGEAPALRTRLSNGARNGALLAAAPEAGLYSEDEPSLGVADPAYAASQPESTRQADANEPRGIRINGRLVSPGQRYSQVELIAANTAPDTGVANVQSIDPAAREKAAIAALAEPEGVSYARPFENPEGKPIVSLVIGGLGTSRSQTISAIDELPADVTLSFIPGASAELMKYARSKGHEILIEVPMEALEAGRARPHRDTLLASAPADQNLIRLKSILQGRREVYGVISSQGGKFVTNKAAALPILAHLQAEGLAFFQHGTLGRTHLADDAASLNMAFAAAQENIDTEIRASEIEAQLFKLETQAIDEGVAFGTGFSYPLTVDLVSRWSRRLEAKGILLAPASAVVAENSKRQRIQTTQLVLPDMAHDDKQ